MLREEILARLESEPDWDIVVIGGGATGLGTAVESASRGYRTLLLEQHDFAKGTSSRSTKLVHGGVRYLQQGNISLVLEALRERGLLMRNAPHLVHNRSFVLPSYDWWNGPFYGVGLKVYDLMAGRLGLGRSRLLSKDKTLEAIPNVEPEGLRGGVIYHDGQFDDSRLAINLAQTIHDLGGLAVNYMRVTTLLKDGEMVAGVIAVDEETGQERKINARAVVNATGIFTDQVLKMDDPGAADLLTVSQGVHIVLEKDFLPGDSAIMVPNTEDGRVLFAVPWHDRVVVGTTDTPMERAVLEPRALEEEIEFILHHAAKYMAKDPGREDARCVFAGLRPLVRPAGNKHTAAISRDHFLVVSQSGLVTITGGKWTTYRKMGEDTINHAAMVAGLEERPSTTAHMPIHGWQENVQESSHMGRYGADAEAVEQTIGERKGLDEVIHPGFSYRKGEVVWHVRKEMARTVEDVLARRLRALILDASVSIEMAPAVADLIASELGYDRKWQEDQVHQYASLAREYLLN